MLIAIIFYLKKKYSTKSNDTVSAGIVLQNSALLLLFFAITLVNLMLPKYFNYSLDLTSESINTLSAETVFALKNIKQNVVLMGFFKDGKISDKRIISLVSLFERASTKFRLELIDPEKRPGLLKTYRINELGGFYLTFDGGATNSEQRGIRISKRLTEESLLYAINRLANVQPKRLAYITGHGEPALEGVQGISTSMFKDVAEGEGISVIPYAIADLGTNSSLVPDAALLVAPRLPLSMTELEQLKRYFESGHGLLLFHEPGLNDSISKLAKSFGMQIDTGVIVDKSQTTYQQGTLGVQPVVKEFIDHPITRDLSSPTLFSSAAAISLSADDPAYTPLARTSTDSWSETDLEKLFGSEAETTKDPVELAGPLTVAAAYEVENKGSRLVLFGDGDILTNSYLPQLSNKELIVNSLLWTLGLQDNIKLRVRTFRIQNTPILAENVSFIMLWFGIIIPEIILIFGLIKRDSKK